MIDAGAGNTMQPTLGKLPDNLRKAGVEPAAVTHILITHLHPDHANGLVDDNGRRITRMPSCWCMRSKPISGSTTRRQRAHRSSNSARTAIDLKPYLAAFAA